MPQLSKVVTKKAQPQSNDSNYYRAEAKAKTYERTKNTMKQKMEQYSSSTGQKTEMNEKISIVQGKNVDHSNYTKPSPKANGYQEGELVYELANPRIDLIVRRNVGKRYYCNKRGQLGGKELVFFERQIAPINQRIQPVHITVNMGGDKLSHLFSVSCSLSLIR